MQHLKAATASFEVHNSPLSEYAAVGFEYGYSVAAPEALVLWEAQFGDFVNGAQIVIDQFIVAGRSKWKQTSRLTLLLPHGYEGNGPEHSSARLERFLQLGAQDNIRVANCTTAAQYFHLLRRQALDAVARPLVLMTPKGLLRLKQATSHLDDLARGSFKAILDDPRLDADQKREVGRLILCSGKVYYDVAGHEAAVAVLAEGLLSLGLLKGSLKDVLASGAYKKFYMHKTGHWLGLDVHDVGEYKVAGDFRELEPGMVFTIEPGLYVTPGLKGVPAKWQGIGIRIEDDVAITRDGHEVLTDAVPKSADAVEALLATRD